MRRSLRVGTPEAHAAVPRVAAVITIVTVYGTFLLVALLVVLALEVVLITLWRR